MKRILFCIVLIATLSGFSLGQKTDENWQRFSPQQDEFAVDTPVDLKQSGDNEKKSSRKYSGSINGAFLYVFSDPVKSKHYSSSIKRFLSDWGQATNSIDLDKQGSSSLSFKDPYGFRQHVVFVRTKTRIYVAQTVSANNSNEVASRFVRSFGLGEKRFVHSLEEDAVAVKPTISDNSLTKTVTGGGSGQGSGSGLGSGNGPGPGSGISSGPRPQPTGGQNSPLRILSKPKARYTDLARFYEISGPVIARVTFLASGEIGSISTIKTLPFGLTEQAVKAAKGIRFEPPYRDGMPMTTVRLVELNFTLY